MKKLLDIFAILAVIAVSVVMIGCGGDDDDDDFGGGQTTGFAPASFANRTITLSEDGQSREVQFATTGNTFNHFNVGGTNAVGSGTYVYTQQGANNGQLILTTPNDDGTSSQVTYNLAFGSAQTGTYTFTTSAGQSGSGTFANFREITTDNSGGNGGTGGGGDNGGNGGTGGGGTGDIPTSLSNRSIDFTATGQGNERLTFGGDNTVTSDAINPPNNVGTYTFTPGTAGSPGTLVITFPNGDNYNLNMTFTDATHGTWSGSQFFDNSSHPVPAGSSFTVQP